MRQPTSIVTAFVVGLFIALPALAHSVTVMTGTIMCYDAHHADRYSTECQADVSRYVLVTSTATYDIKHQEFSGLHQLVGTAVKVVGNVKGHVIDILEVQEVLSPDPGVGAISSS